MGVELAGAIVVVDEAHNVEDVARQGASLSLSQRHLLQALQDIEQVRYRRKVSYSVS